jgi:hypothetical protein
MGEEQNPAARVQAKLPATPSFYNPTPDINPIKKLFISYLLKKTLRNSRTIGRIFSPDRDRNGEAISLFSLLSKQFESFKV